MVVVKRSRPIQALLYRAIDLVPFLLPLLLINFIDHHVFHNHHGDRKNHRVHDDQRGSWTFVLDPTLLVVLTASILLLVLNDAVRRTQVKLEDPDGAALDQVKGEKNAITITSSTRKDVPMENEVADTCCPSSQTREEYKRPKTSCRKRTRIHESLQQQQQEQEQRQLYTEPTQSEHVVRSDNRHNKNNNNNAALLSNNAPCTMETHDAYHCPVPGCAFQIYFLQQQLERHNNMTLIPHDTAVDDVDVRWPTMFLNQQVEMRKHYVVHHPEIHPTDWPPGFAYASSSTSGHDPSTSSTAKYLKDTVVTQSKQSQSVSLQSSSPSKRTLDPNTHTNSNKRQRG